MILFSQTWHDVNCMKGMDFKDSLSDAFLIQMVTNPTRRREGQRPTMDDLVLVSDDKLISDITHRPPVGKSDHEVLSFTLYVNETMQEDENVLKYNLGKGNYSRLREHLADIQWGCLDSLSVEDCWKEIKGTMTDVMDKCIPKVKIKPGGKSKPPWMSNKVTKKEKDR